MCLLSFCLIMIYPNWSRDFQITLRNRIGEMYTTCAAPIGHTPPAPPKIMTYAQLFVNFSNVQTAQFPPVQPAHCFPSSPCTLLPMQPAPCHCYA